MNRPLTKEEVEMTNEKSDLMLIKEMQIEIMKYQFYLICKY